MSWAVAALVLIAVAIAVPYFNRKTCMNAFARGMRDAELPFLDVAKNYAGFFSPLRPMDAAAYRLGVGFMARAIVCQDTVHPGEYFAAAWKQKEILNGGTAIRHLIKLMGTSHAAALFSLPLGEDVMAIVEEGDFELTPVQALAIAIDRRSGKSPEP